MFVPDPGKTMFDIDLDSADLRIVTWESNCRWMKEQFAAGNKPYVELAREYHHDPTITKQHFAYKRMKKFCHGTNYLGMAKNLAPQCGLLVHESEKLQKWYFGVCPEIAKWQEKFQAKFMSTGTVENAFGYRCKWFDRLDGNAVNKAIAWLPQSTVGLIINHAWANIDEQLPDVEILLQVHDSLVGQFPTGRLDLVDRILECSRIVVPYADPLVVPIGLKTSTSSWGDCS